MPERPSRAISQPDAGVDRGDGGRSLPGEPGPAAEPEPESGSRLRSFIIAEAVACAGRRLAAVGRRLGPPPNGG